ncbi:hypothetical protein FM076_16395 [Streptomyces albus subsp. chlorinus]|uniref:hypothetical protein n=1 Tax=Streptomyces albus TaxID=1888 RepID=UPI00156FD789|nr:hypothetical protein [Streptomyces albus]NSC22666.1 hypothetical protein [Streptomyces albus subsp. chlorinus]
MLERWKEESKQFSWDGIESKREFLTLSQNRVANRLESYRKGHGISDDSEWYNVQSSAMEQMYGIGAVQGDQGDRD